MSTRLGAAWSRYVGLGGLSLALLAAPAIAAPSAQALPVPGPGVECLAPTGTPDVKRAPDTPPVSPATLTKVRRQVAAATAERASTSARASALPVYRVKVQIHVIHGRHRGEHVLKKRGAKRKVFDVLRSAYNGAESTVSEPMGIVFDLKRITITKNDRWYHARQGSRADRQMRTRLHRGTAQTLNIYVNRPRPPARFSGLLLGYSTFPWNYRGRKKLDGVVVNIRSLSVPHSRPGFNLGDTVVHETGHWLGLLHTFQGGCGGYNDGVHDTAAEVNEMGNQHCSDPANICAGQVVAPWTTQPTTDHYCTLATPCADPAFNFMEYTRDACMRMFTVGQRERVDKVFRTFRLNR